MHDKLDALSVCLTINQGRLDENQNGLTRQLLPKSMGLEKIGTGNIAMIHVKANNRDKNILDYLTHHETYEAMFLAACFRPYSNCELKPHLLSICSKTLPY